MNAVSTPYRLFAQLSVSCQLQGDTRPWIAGQSRTSVTLSLLTINWLVSPLVVSICQRCSFDSRFRFAKQAFTCTTNLISRQAFCVSHESWLEVKYTDNKRSHNLAPEKCPICETLQVTNLAYMKTEVIWDFTPCRLVHSYPCFGDAQCLHLHGQVQ